MYLTRAIVTADRQEHSGTHRFERAPASAIDLADALAADFREHVSDLAQQPGVTFWSCP